MSAHLGSLEEARALDRAAGEAALRRDAFHMPPGVSAYMCGNSLGLCPRAAQRALLGELEAWQKSAVDGHFKDWRGWYRYHEHARGPLERLVGARHGEVVAMNSLTVNLHLLLTSFYRPEGSRTKLLMESPAFPSDTFAVETHVRSRGLEPDTHVITVQGDSDGLFGVGCFERAIADAGDELACVLLPGVSFLTGEVLDMASIAAAAHEVGATVGFDLAHAAGNIPLSLHDWDVDFAAWCSYKYLNAGPGAIAGAFVHERHHSRSQAELPRLSGWWGTDPDTRFDMHLNDGFEPVASVDAWQCSNPPVMAMAPLLASLDLFDQVGMTELRERSLRLTSWLRSLLEFEGAPWRIITPKESHRHGAQLSVHLHIDAGTAQRRLQDQGVLADVRPPSMIRLAPTPLYSTFEDCWHVADAMRRCLT
ncbi:MAG: kynureninase [Phycisphaerales bacterium]|nr:kynureninase [Phycisphaerales bacterium]